MAIDTETQRRRLEAEIVWASTLDLPKVAIARIIKELELRKQELQTNK